MSFPPGTEMFQFPGFASRTYEFSTGYPKGVGFPIRTSADQRSLASPRGFSQRATSFIASWRQGIHRTPFCHSISLPPPPARRTKAHRSGSERVTEALAQSLTLIHSITCSLRHVAFQTVRAASWQPKGCLPHFLAASTCQILFTL